MSANELIDPIFLDVDISTEEYEFDGSSPVNVTVVEGGVPAGGNAGEVLTKVSDADHDVAWLPPQSGSESGLPAGGAIGDLLAKRSEDDYDAEWITPATSVEQDNTRPITAAAVYTEIGNINALLATI